MERVQNNDGTSEFSRVDGSRHTQFPSVFAGVAGGYLLCPCLGEFPRQCR